MAQYIIMGQIGKEKSYLSYEGEATWWSDSIKNAKLFNSQAEASDALRDITNEKESLMIGNHTPYYSAPRTLSVLAGINKDKPKADVRISICCVSPIPLTIERWHVENGKGNTKRLN